MPWREETASRHRRDEAPPGAELADTPSAVSRGAI